MTKAESLFSYADIRKVVAATPFAANGDTDRARRVTPIPTLRWGPAAYAFFAGPVGRWAGHPSLQGAPDRW